MSEKNKKNKDLRDVENYTKEGKAVLRAGSPESEKNRFRGMPAWMADGPTAVSRASKDYYAAYDEYRPRKKPAAYDVITSDKDKSKLAYQNSWIAKGEKASKSAREAALKMMKTKKRRG
jgi:hypothetical protein